MDVYEIIRICNMHPRVNILQPGPGVGGHCISVDPWFLVGDYPQLAKVIDESMKTFDPFFTEKAIVKNQLLDFDQFLSEVDMVVIMVMHDHIKQNWDKLKGKVVLDCHNICPLEGVYHVYFKVQGLKWA